MFVEIAVEGTPAFDIIKKVSLSINQTPSAIKSKVNHGLKQKHKSNLSYYKYIKVVDVTLWQMLYLCLLMSDLQVF